MSNNNQSGGVGIGTVLFLIFLVLKLCNVIDWSWWWIFSPILFPIAIIGLIVVVGLIQIKIRGY